jgi:hypothetical protein
VAAEQYEPVHTVEDYYDGPRAGTADFEGQPHAYRSLHLDTGGFKDNEDRFELRLLTDGQPTGPPFLARGDFRVRGPGSELPPGVIRPLEVHWTVIRDPRGDA